MIRIAVAAGATLGLAAATQLETRYEVLGAREHPADQPATLTDERVSDRVARVLDDFHDAAAKADFDRYFRLWTDESVFLGTDATERWVGKEFKDFAKPYFDQGKGWSYKPRSRHVSLARDGTLAWFDELLDNEKYGVCRGSGVLVRAGTDWKVLQYNLSFMVPNDLADKVTGLIRSGAK